MKTRKLDLGLVQLHFYFQLVQKCAPTQGRPNWVEINSSLRKIWMIFHIPYRTKEGGGKIGWDAGYWSCEHQKNPRSEYLQSCMHAPKRSVSKVMVCRHTNLGNWWVSTTTEAKTLNSTGPVRRPFGMSRGDIVLKAQAGTHLSQIFTRVTEAYIRKWSVRETKQAES